MPQLEAKQTSVRTQEENVYPHRQHWLHGMHSGGKSSISPTELSMYTL